MNADRGSLKAETTEKENQNLATLLTAYTSGLDRGRSGSDDPGDEG
ncbi:MAG: hypothetical protein IPG97_02090 [Microthrixaceae bacterium]|nr:hypothetical protein [Microthrixaceae bacterium]